MSLYRNCLICSGNNRVRAPTEYYRSARYIHGYCRPCYEEYYSDEILGYQGFERIPDDELAVLEVMLK